MASFISSMLNMGTYDSVANTFTATSNSGSVTSLATDGLPDTTFTVGEQITVTSFGSTPVTYVAHVGDGWVGTVGGEAILFSNSASFTGEVIPTSATPFDAPCFTRGTMILTPDGEKPVEALRPGQLVVTQVDGVAIPRAVKWVGHRRFDLTRHPRADAVAPIRIERDAFADNVPHRDLLLSPDHAVFVDGKLICVRQLVNGSTIRWERGWTAVDYYHVQLDRHDILLAEGLTVESYLDTGNRAFFANSGMPLVLHPDLPNDAIYPTRESGSCAPLVSDEAGVQPVWQRVAGRAATIGRAVPVRVTTTDAAPQLQCPGGRAIAPIHRDGDRVIFALPRDASEVRLVSRAQSPTEARPWLEDNRRLGIRVKRIMLRSAEELREVPVDHPDLTRGWWAVERDGQVMSRWTDGEAVLPLPEMCGPVMLEIHLAGSMTYVVDAVSVGKTERRAAA